MPLSIDDIQRIAAEAARAASPQLEVTGVHMSGGTSYSEVLVTIRGCRTERCQVSIGVFRDGLETTIRENIAAALQRHLSEHVEP